MKSEKRPENAPESFWDDVVTDGKGKSLSAHLNPFPEGGEHIPAQEALPVPPRVYKLELPEAFAGLLAPARYKVFYGGRGGGKSWAFADALITEALRRRVRVLCARELQVSIADSVYRLLIDRITSRQLDGFFRWTQTGIQAVNGSEFLFKGLRHNAAEIKSLEGVDLCWVEEAQKVSRESWELLIPTIRKEGSEIWVSFNPGGPDDDTWRRFVKTEIPGALVRKITWRDNPWFPSTLEAERAYAREVLDPDDYAHIWEGEPRAFSDAQVFKGRYVVQNFATPPGVRFYFGADWGFAADPTTLVRAFVAGEELRVDYEAWAKGCELENLHTLFDQIPGARRWAINADASRPEIIRSMRRRGFCIRPGKKWAGSVEEGVTVLRSFRRIVVHPRCVHTAEEMRLYSYKTDAVNGDILPVLLDRDNHCIDALRYAMEPWIRGRRQTK